MSEQDYTQTPREGDTTWADNPELYEVKILLCSVFRMASATPTWRRDLLEYVQSARREAVAYRRLVEDVRKTVTEADDELKAQRELDRVIRNRRRQEYMDAQRRKEAP